MACGTAPLQATLLLPASFPGPCQDPTNASRTHHLRETRAPPLRVLGQPRLQVFRHARIVLGVLIGGIEVEQIDGHTSTSCRSRVMHCAMSRSCALAYCCSSSTAEKLVRYSVLWAMISPSPRTSSAYTQLV